MRRLRVLLFRLRGLFRTRQLDRDLEDEIASHLADAAEEYVRQGLSAEDAHIAARRRFGGVTQTQDVYRQVRSFGWLDDVWRDVCYALRTLRRSPTFSVAAIATLALSIGATTTMFSVVNATLLRPLPYRSPEQLAMLWTEDPAQNLREGRSALVNVEQWRSQSRSFVDLATYDAVSTRLTTSEGTEQLVGASVSPHILGLLGVQPILGRDFSAEDVTQGEHVALVSRRFWQARFGGSPGIVGTTMVLAGTSTEIVGVLPAGFQIGHLKADVMMPHPPLPDVDSRQQAANPETWFVIGRLRPDATLDTAQAEMSAIAGRLNAGVSDTERRVTVMPLDIYMLGPQARVGLWTLAGAVFCLFLVAVANIASLCMARAMARAPEMRVRTALGAGVRQIVRPLIAENAILAVISGAIGMLLTFSAVQVVRALGPEVLARLGDVEVDVVVLGWGLAATVLAAVPGTAAQAFVGLRRQAGAPSHSGDRTVASSVSAHRFRRSLVVAEFALAIVLLAGAGLLVRSWWFVNGIDPGFAPERVLLMELSAPVSFSTPPRRNDLYRRVCDALRAVPGVDSVGIVGDLFIANSREQAVSVEGGDNGLPKYIRLRGDEVNADFFDAMGTPLLRGRTFSPEDAQDTTPVAVINIAMARAVWPDQDPLGKRFRVGQPDSHRPWLTVVGVVADMRRQGPERAAIPQSFIPLAQSTPGSIDLVIRTSSARPAAMAGTLREAIRRVEKNAPVYGIAPLTQRFQTYLVQRRLQTWLLVGFSAIALLMAAIGIYGVVQFSVASRAREIGLRVAVGAQASDIFTMVAREGLVLAVMGLALGLVGAVWVGHAAASLLVGITGGDPSTLATVSLLLMAVAMCACGFPARRAMTIDPVVALRLT